MHELVQVWAVVVQWEARGGIGALAIKFEPWFLVEDLTRSRLSSRRIRLVRASEGPWAFRGGRAGPRGEVRGGAGVCGGAWWGVARVAGGVRSDV